MICNIAGRRTCDCTHRAVVPGNTSWNNLCKKHLWCVKFWREEMGREKRNNIYLLIFINASSLNSSLCWNALQVTSKGHKGHSSIQWLDIHNTYLLFFTKHMFMVYLTYPSLTIFCPSVEEGMEPLESEIEGTSLKGELCPCFIVKP